MKKGLVELIRVPSFTTDGTLTQLQSPEIPFDVKRVYFIQGVSVGAIRGAHTHKETRQILFCIQGSIKMVLDNGKKREEIILDKPNLGIFLEPRMWHEMQDFKKDTILLILASKEYKVDDYIKSYEDFLNSYAKH